MAISLQVEKFSRFQANVLGPSDSFTFEKLAINDTFKKQTTHSFVNNTEWNEAFVSNISQPFYKTYLSVLWLNIQVRLNGFLMILTISLMSLHALKYGKGVN